jgi:uncharacterized HAD superfamily protein
LNKKWGNCLRLLKLGFDIDGVISDFLATFKEIVREKYKIDLKEKEIYCLDLDLVLGISKADCDELIRETLRRDINLLPGAKEALKEIAKKGHEIYIFTARFSDFEKITKKWLDKNCVPYRRIIQSEMGEKYQKVEHLDIVVEDNLYDALNWTRKSDKVLVFDHPWNKTLNVNCLLKRVYTWAEVFKEVQKTENT